MKKLNIIAIALLTVFIATSCSESLLDIPQKGIVPMSDFYQTEEDAESSVVALYYTLGRALARPSSGGSFQYSPYTVLYNLPSDDIYGAGSHRGDNEFLAQINEFRHATDNEVVRNMYQGLYRGIYAANLVIINYADMEASSTKIARCVAEARAWRAWCHMMLGIGWGTPPIITTLLTGSEQPENSNKEELWNWIIEEFTAAAPLLPSRASVSDKDGAVRLTKEAAYAFMGKAQVQCGKYAEAAQNLKNNVINSGKYALVSGAEMFDLFHMDGNGSSEKVFEFNVQQNPNVSFFNTIATWQQNSVWNWRADKFASVPSSIFGGGWGGCNPSRDFAEALIANDGIDSYRRKAWFLTYDEVLYGQPYTSDVDEDGNPLTQAQKETDKNRGISSGTGLYGHAGYFTWKILRMARERWTNWDAFNNNYVIMRYAEVLLLYAEACVQSGTDLAGGLEALNSIQRRAGSNYISPALTLEDVKNEKRFEMWLEGTRWADLVRWGDAASKLATNGANVPSFLDLMGKEHPETGVMVTKHTGYVTPEGSTHKGGDYGFKANKHELFPFPFNEIMRNAALVQNPGWE